MPPPAKSGILIAPRKAEISIPTPARIIDALRLTDMNNKLSTKVISKAIITPLLQRVTA